MFKKFDNSGRTPRESQTEALDWIKENWNTTQILAINAPTAVGKSAIARAIQIAKGGHVVTISNMLLDQYTNTYPEVNSLKGKVHYYCKEYDTDCETASSVRGKSCKDCIYTTKRKTALSGEPTFLNPMSYHYLTINENFKTPEVLIIDEAHLLGDMISGLSGMSFSTPKYQVPETVKDEADAAKWMDKQIPFLRNLRKQASGAAKRTLDKEIDKLCWTLTGLREDQENYAVFQNEGPYRNRRERYLNVFPIVPPRWLTRPYLDPKKIILMSATLTDEVIQDLFPGVPYKKLDLDSPIDKDRRPVQYAPAKQAMNSKTDPQDVADWVDGILDKHEGENTVIHVTYAMSKKLAPLLRHKVITNTPKTKDESLLFFKLHGGIFLAAGCAEGIDLHDDLCTVQIVPMLFRLNPTDPVIRKRMGKKGGNKWYNMHTLKTLIQQVGRGCRHENDSCITYVGDPRLPQLISRSGLDVPKSFKSSLRWSI